MEKTIILGGGIAGLSLGSFLDGKSIILERDSVVGGLCRSYDLNGIVYDVGPHIIFSKNKDVLRMHTTMIKTNEIRRSNHILHKGRLVKYPFENDLAALEEDEKNYCLNEFLSNPYENIPSSNMQQFFLKTFGEGITHTYLQPYNEKIWKFDPAYMDTQMVERIPKPPREDVIKSAQGVATEGYTHQLYFHYPQKNGFQELVDAYAKSCANKAQIETSVAIQKIKRAGKEWHVETDKGTFKGDRLVNCIPLHELFKLVDPPPAHVITALENLKYNSIHIIMVQTKVDNLKGFAYYIPDKDVIFHRLSRLNFLGDSYKMPNGGATLLCEVTFRPKSHLATLSKEEILNRTLQGLSKLGITSEKDVTATELKTFKYAYVIYDIDHRKNADTVLNYLLDLGIRCSGRFAEFEYLNSDQVVERTLKLSQILNQP